MDRIKAYQPEVYGFIFFLLLLNAWYLSGVAIDNRVIPKGYDIALSFLIPLMSGFFGAYSAFKLREKEERAKTYENEVAAINTALFILGRQLNVIGNIRNAISLHKSDENRAIKLRANEIIDYKAIRLNLDTLGFLIPKGQTEILFALALEQELFELAIGVLETRSQFHIDHFQPAFEKLDIQNSDIHSREDFIAAIGEGLHSTLKVHTDNLYNTVEKSFISLYSTQERLRPVAFELYPNASFFSYELSEEYK
ncbi:MAG: hypothetical protein RPT25_00635 [Cycloclasticus sp.]|jgi:hypothetical protein